MDSFVFIPRGCGSPPYELRLKQAERRYQLSYLFRSGFTPYYALDINEIPHSLHGIGVNGFFDDGVFRDITVQHVGVAGATAGAAVVTGFCVESLNVHQLFVDSQ